MSFMLHVFPRFSLVECFSALGIGYMFSRAWHWLHVFPRLALVTHFPALGTRYMFSRAWHSLHVFPRLVLDTCFPALGTHCLFSQYAWHFLAATCLHWTKSQSQFLPDNEGEMWNSTCDPWTQHTWIHILALWEGGIWTEKQIVTELCNAFGRSLYENDVRVILKKECFI